MEVKEIAHYWSRQRIVDGRWLHPEDATELARVRHPFNLDHPVVPFVGDVCAPVVILGANPGYSKATPMSFAEEGDIENALKQVASGRTTRLACRVSYYTTRNYWERLRSGRVVVVNACPYRSPDTSGLNRLVGGLASVRFAWDWLREAIGPLAAQGKRLVVAWRPGLWNDALQHLDPAALVSTANPRSPDLSWEQMAQVEDYLRHQEGQGGG